MSDESTVLHGEESLDGSGPPPTTDVVEAPAEPELLLVPQEIPSNIVNPAKLTAMLRRKFGIRSYKIRMMHNTYHVKVPRQLSAVVSQAYRGSQAVIISSSSRAFWQHNERDAYQVFYQVGRARTI
ncbi:hypothetical protein F4679DRAFT_344802 [Xylaria curta]|nr:hypothetical protein F4679DRAFT_344802 [Xylaria curta]